MVTTTYEAEATSYNNPNNMFKALGGIVYKAALTASIPAAFTANSTSDLVQLDPLVWFRLGLVTQKGGVSFGRSTKEDDEMSWGYDEPTRTDISQDISSAVFELQEVNRYALEMYHSVDLSGTHPDATTGEFAFNKPQLTVPVYQRLIFLAVDGVGTDRRYQFKVMPRASVTTIKDETWDQTAATTLNLTITAKVDPVLGYSVRHVLAGPGQKTRNSAAYFI